jgi:hypothetical protein
MVVIWPLGLPVKVTHLCFQNHLANSSPDVQLPLLSSIEEGLCLREDAPS